VIVDGDVDAILVCGGPQMLIHSAHALHLMHAGPVLTNYTLLDRIVAVSKYKTLFTHIDRAAPSLPSSLFEETQDVTAMLREVKDQKSSGSPPRGGGATLSSSQLWEMVSSSRGETQGVTAM